MARPDKEERARRQKLAAERRDREEQERLDAEKREQEEAAVAYDAWAAKVADEEDAAAQAEYAGRAVKALDQLARLIAEQRDRGEEIPLDYAEDILREAGHVDFLPDSGWCGTGL